MEKELKIKSKTINKKKSHISQRNVNWNMNEMYVTDHIQQKNYCVYIRYTFLQRLNRNECV